MTLIALARSDGHTVFTRPERLACGAAVVDAPRQGVAGPMA